MTPKPQVETPTATMLFTVRFRIIPSAVRAKARVRYCGTVGVWVVWMLALETLDVNYFVPQSKHGAHVSMVFATISTRTSSSD